MPKQFNACQIILITASGMTTGKTKQQQQKERKKERKENTHTHTHTLYSIKTLIKMTFS